jgi:hypothetical protein
MPGGNSPPATDHAINLAGQRIDYRTGFSSLGLRYLRPPGVRSARFGSIKPDIIADSRQTHTQAAENSSPTDREGNPNAQFTRIEPISRSRSGGVLKKLVAPAANEFCT